MYSKVLLYLLAFVFIAAGCGKSVNVGQGNNSDQGGKISEQGFEIIEKGSLKIEGSALEGSGSIVFTNPLPANKSNVGLDVSFELGDGGYLEVISHSNKDLSSGVVIKISRVGSQIYAIVRTPLSTPSAQKLLPQVSTGPSRLLIDVHNNESPTHILAWATGTSIFSEASSILNTEQDYALNGQGSGGFWGLKLLNAKVTAAAQGKARLEDE